MHHRTGCTHGARVLTGDSTVIVGPMKVTTLETGGAWRENCYVLEHLDSRETAVIDPGDDPDRIIDAALGDGAVVRHLLLTHAHYDHVGAAAAIARRFGLACRLHTDDERLLRHAPMYALAFARRRIERPSPVNAFRDPPELRLGGVPIGTVHTPGHTPGSVCYFAGDLVFTGDTLLAAHVGRTDLPGGDWDSLAMSITSLVADLPEQTVVLPGHGSRWTIGEARAWWPEASLRRPFYRGEGETGEMRPQASRAGQA
jgi:hydroxyacylglutathione hydrolase